MEKLIVLIALFFLFSSPAFAIEEMTDENIKKAIEYGKNPETCPFTAKVYTIYKGQKGGGSDGQITEITSETPFLKLCQASNIAKSRYEKFSLKEAKTLLEETNFFRIICLFGAKFPAFLPNHGLLVQIKNNSSEVIIQPLKAEYEDMSPRSYSHPGLSQIGILTLDFPLSKINQHLKTFLILIPSRSGLAGRKFKIDLKKIR